MKACAGLPRITWIASRPPIPPWSGVQLTALCGLRSLAADTHTQVVTYANSERDTTVAASFADYWTSYGVHLVRVLPLATRRSVASSLVAHHFQTSTMLMSNRLHEVLEALDWRDPCNLLVFDDIAFAPLMPRYGCSAILSPHDCLSAMFLSHARSSGLTYAAASSYARYRTALHYERQYYHLPLLTHVVTHRDRALLQQINSRARYHVVPNGDWAPIDTLRANDPRWDVMIWVDLSLQALARDTRRVLRLAKRSPLWDQTHRLIVVGRVPRSVAERILGSRTLSGVDYASRLESQDGKTVTARVILIPDTGGAGIKSRCVSVLAAGGCLASVYRQMEGLEKAQDLGAINASDHKRLLARVARALSDGSYREIAIIGKSIYDEHYGERAMRENWQHMVRRAVTLRHISNGD